jgi:hypothetical protein
MCFYISDCVVFWLIHFLSLYLGYCLSRRFRVAEMALLNFAWGKGRTFGVGLIFESPDFGDSFSRQKA